jgi:hypothetical protein
MTAQDNCVALPTLLLSPSECWERCLQYIRIGAATDVRSEGKESGMWADLADKLIPIT